MSGLLLNKKVVYYQYVDCFKASHIGLKLNEIPQVRFVCHFTIIAYMLYHPHEG